MQALLIPMGTPGDVQPFIDLGCALRRRGHVVRLVAHDPFKSRAIQCGFEFESIGNTNQFDQLLNDRNLWNPLKAYRVFAKKLVVPSMRPIVDAVCKHQTDETVVYAQSMALGARVAQDKFGLKTITVHRQPSFLRSMTDTSKAPSMLVPRWMPKAAKGAQFRVIDAILDHPYVPPVNELRGELGLSPITRWSKSWLNSPDGVLGFWNDWFAPPQEDWPGNVSLAGFIADETGEDQPSEKLKQFIDNGEPPIVFTFGSGNRFSERMLAVGAEACRKINRRGLLVSRTKQSHELASESVMQVDYAPFSWLLPRSAAIVHHAGIGTVGQALAAGVPQLSVAGLVFDTTDTAHRLSKLGVSRRISVRRFSAARAADVLLGLMEDERIKSRARELSISVRSSDALRIACETGERLIGSA